MKFYRTEYADTAVDDLNGSAHATLAEAHAHAKAYMPRESARVTLREVATDQRGVIALLNGSASTACLREWKLSPRGGLVEVEIGTDKPLVNKL